ncbi:MAG: head-tail connector protein [Desulfovibrionaceae bacterium]|nr:head-tail connector protein [Desulfovibrionaceae bacterium]
MGPAASPSPDNAPDRGTAEQRYLKLAQERQPYLDRARACASLTIPLLIPPDDLAKGQSLPGLYQSVGANGVTNLASKLLLTMLPPNEPCFRLRVNNMMIEKDEEEVDKEFRTRVDKALSRIEQAVLADIEATGDRVTVYAGNEHLIVAGNVLYHDDGDSGLRMFPLSRYVVDRDPMGTPVEIIVEETVSPDVLPEDFATTLKAATEDAGTVPRGDNQDVTVYTHLKRVAEKWTIHQECRGRKIPGSAGSYRTDACPWFPVRMYAIPGEDYGRSFVELQQGDLTSLESLNQSLVEGSAVAAKVVGMVNPNSVTSARAVAEAANGDIIEGMADDVSFLQIQKGADFQVVAAQIQSLEQRLKTAFLMMDGVRRHAERVTAEEIRVLAQELETGLGGVYTIISQEFQLPYIRSRMARMTRAKRIPELPKGIVQPSVVTGFDALGRGNDKQKLLEFLQFGASTFGEQFLALVNPHNAVTRLASSMGIPTEGLIKDEEQMLQEQRDARQQAQQQMLVETLGPEALRQFGGMAQQQAETQSPPQQPSPPQGVL